MEQIGNSRIHGKFNYLIALIIAVMHALALYGAIRYWSWAGVAALLVIHNFFMIFGITLGHHRYFSHKNFKAIPVVDRFLGICALLCFQGGPIFWSSVHRAHHALSEKKGDAHSATEGFLWSHCVWLFYSTPNGFSFIQNRSRVRDLLSNDFVKQLDSWNLWVNLGSLVALYALCYFLGYVELYYWIGPIRVVTVWHATWSTNSFMHGARFFGGRSAGIRNSIVPDITSAGEGWHRSHHEYPGRLTHRGFLHFDLGYRVLVIMSWLRLVTIPSRSSEVSESDSVATTIR